MKCTFFTVIAAAAFCALPSVCQEKVPIYRVTVIQRSVDAVNYQYRSGPTKIDFRGTVLLPAAKGDATVDPQKGRTAIEAKFEGLEAPQRFGPEYLSYVLWAVTPAGASYNLGEIVPNASNHGHMTVTTEIPAFGLIVTAEPYAAVRQPSDVIVLENRVRADTIGEIKPIQVKAELMPRGKYTWDIPATESAEFANAPKVSMGRYQAILQIYEAENAMGVARAAGAQQYAPDVYAKAQQELDQAQQLQSSKGNDDRIVQYARAATEIAEDARTIAERQKQTEEIVAARKETAEAQMARQEAEAKVERERERADNAQAQAQTEREGRERAELEARMARERSEQPAPAVIPSIAAPSVQPAQTQSNLDAAMEERVRLLQRLNNSLVVRDSPRGLDATLTDADFAGAQLRPSPANAIGRAASVLALHPELRIKVEGNSDSPEGSALAAQRAAAVSAALVRAGVPAPQVSSESLGNSRPVVSNATSRGRTENRRVEILISGDAIGSVPTWDRTYPLSFNKK